MYADLGDTNIAYGGYAYTPFGQRIPLTTTRTPLQTTFGVNAPTLGPSYKPPTTTTTVKPTITAIPVPTTRLPVLVPKPTPLTPGTFGTPSVNVSVSGGGGGGSAPSGSDTPEVGTTAAGIFGLSDVNPTTLIFLGMAALVMFMESGKKGRR